jgi:hypothetical protein
MSDTDLVPVHEGRMSGVILQFPSLLDPDLEPPINGVRRKAWSCQQPNDEGEECNCQRWALLEDGLIECWDCRHITSLRHFDPTEPPPSSA